MSRITTDELRAEVERINLNRTHPSGFTCKEFAAAMGWAYGTAQRKLSILVQTGHAKFVGNRPVTRMDGKPGINPVYAVIKNR